MDILNPIFLHIETATEICSVALTEGDQVLSICETDDGNSHSKNLLPFIDQALKDAGRQLQDIHGVVVSIGPGSYTGLRIGVSTAKSIAYAQEVPVITVNTLESIAWGAYKSCNLQDQSFSVVPMIDARRMEVFTTRFDQSMNRVEEVTALIVEDGAFANLLSTQKVVFCGNGMPKCKELLSSSENACFVDAKLSAQNMLPVALQKWQTKDFADVAYFEPFYLKEYVAAKPNVKGLH